MSTSMQGFYAERLARPKRFELLTPRFVVWCSIQLSYGRARRGSNSDAAPPVQGRGAKAAHGREKIWPAAVRLTGPLALPQLIFERFRSRKVAD